ncbi:hypothetical protein ABZT45_50880, partial [Streptomyces sp. NPDC005356]
WSAPACCAPRRARRTSPRPRTPRTHRTRRGRARDSTGTFYPLAERITGWTENDPDAFLDRLRGDLLHHVGGHLNDDAAMIVIERTATPRA